MKFSVSILMAFLGLCGVGCGDNGLAPPDNPHKETTEVVEGFNNIPTLDEMVVYQVNMRAISSLGTFRGVQARLDNIAEIGANVIWLMPIYPVGIEKGINSPYAPKDYESVGSEYGTLNDLIRLVNDAHSRDIAVILDWVGNHTSWDHSWVTDHPDWYAKDGDGNMIPPPGTNWTDVVELDFSSTAMREEMIASMQYWVENAGIDGFRCDAADFVPSGFWAEAITSLKAGTDKDLILLAEGSTQANFSAGFEMDYAWDFNHSIRQVFSEGRSAISLATVHAQEYGRIPDGAEKLRYITNHDVYAWESTVVDDFSATGSVTAFVITAYMGGTPLIYDGQEVARPTTINFLTSDPIDWNQNPDIYDAYVSIMSARADLPAVHSGGFESYSSSDVVVFKRSNSEQEVLVLANVRNSPKTYELPDALTGTDWVNVLTENSVSLAGSMDLGAYEYVILKH